MAIVDDAAFTIGSANLNLRSMAIDSELNILSQAKDVSYKLRCDLFIQCFGEPGPDQFGDMGDTFNRWQERMADNARAMKKNDPLKATSNNLVSEVVGSQQVSSVSRWSIFG